MKHSKYKIHEDCIEFDFYEDDGRLSICRFDRHHIMGIKNLIVPLILTIIYWTLSGLVLFDIIVYEGPLFPDRMDELSMPGYMIGFGLCYCGGNYMAIIGQIISFVLIGFTFIALFELLKLIPIRLRKILK